jgi:flavin-dependent dehydrogenase
MSASDAYDVVVIGAGAGGMTAAVVAAAEGLSVLLIEKTEFVGGTTACIATCGKKRAIHKI